MGPIAHPGRTAGPPFRCRAVIFDLDGTLIDTIPDIATAVDRALVDVSRPPIGASLVRSWVGNGAEQLLERAIAHSGAATAGEVSAALALFKKHYADVLTDRSRLYDGVFETLRMLADRGRRLAICSNKPSKFVKPLLDHFRVAQYFAMALGGDDLPQKKPDPAPLLHIAVRFGIPAADCLMVGDSRNDVESARGAGMAVVAVSYGYNYGADIRDSGPDAVIDSIGELLGLIT